MCTVTITPIGENDFVLTSNRDESPERIPMPPAFYTINNTKLLFPKDKKGGTWVGISQKKRIICLLNGGFVKHKRQPSYKKSRGIVVNDFMLADTIVSTIENYDFENIEPFTIVIADWNSNLKFYELVWDGKCKHFTELTSNSRIWSSSTLYNERMQSERQNWFDDFNATSTVNAESLLDFHTKKDNKNMDYGVIMDRGNVKTTSITQIVKTGNAVTMHYKNRISGLDSYETFNFSEIING